MRSILTGFALLGMLLILSSYAPAGKKMQGDLHLETGLFDQVKGEQPCKLDSAEGFVVELSKEVENPLFESKAPNQVRLLLWLAGKPESGKRYYVPGDDFKGLCYREEGDLLMFETFEGSGWVEFEEGKKKGKMDGNIDLKLVEPHHNFSNSDFHHLGGSFRLAR